jgi:tetratricopeptide (TPR) repeat protein
MRPARLLAAAAMASAALALGAQSSDGRASPSQPSTSASQASGPVPSPPPTSVQDAAAKLAKISAPADYAKALEAYSSSLPPADALALLDRNLSSAAPEYRRGLIVKAGDLALLLGLFQVSGSRYEEAARLSSSGGLLAASPDGALLLRASRSYLASGDLDKATQLASVLAAGTEPPLIVKSARLIQAWSFLLQGKNSDATAIASAAAAESGPAWSALRREARFILWVCASGSEKKVAAAALSAEFPGSPEAQIANGVASPPPLPHWYLGGLTEAQSDKAKALSLSPGLAVPSAGQGITVTGAGPPAAFPVKRLQVGYFSVEDNAQALKDELAIKGFSAVIEQRLKTAGSGSSGTRWVVIVAGGADAAKTMQSLKDAGYESYVVD